MAWNPEIEGGSLFLELVVGVAATVAIGAAAAEMAAAAWLDDMFIVIVEGGKGVRAMVVVER